MSYTTVNEVAAFCNREVASLSTAERSLMDSTILYVDDIIANYVGWDMLAADYTDKRYNGSGGATLDLRIYPLNYVTQIRVRDTGGIFTDITADTEILEGGVLGFIPGAATSVFTAGSSNIFVSFNAGFEEIPSALAYAATQLASLIFQRASQETMDMKSEAFEQKTQEYSDIDFPPMVKRVLDRYRLVSVF